MDAQKIRQAGERSYFENKGRFVCPYRHGTPEFNEFERGWVQAQKRDPSPPAVAPPAAWDYTQARTPAPEPYNAYADEKGRSEPRR